jgi:hypothetical protein
MPATTGMKGEGFYDRNSAAQLAAIRLVLGWLEEAVAALPLPTDPQPITALDLGSSEGRNALVAMKVLAGAVRRRTGQPVQTVYSDLPGNNFNRLFQNLDETRKAGDSPADVYPSAAAGSFFEPLLPPGTAHLATCFNALLWLDHVPAAVPDFVAYRRPHPPRPGLAVPAETAAAFTRQADADLVRFLGARARELVPGGKLLLGTPGDGPDHRLCDGIYDLLNDACLDLVAAGRVGRAAYEGLTMPVYFRTVEEMLAPLGRADSPVRGAFTVDRAETLDVPTPFVVEYERTGDVNAYAEDYTGFLRAFSEPVARSALVGSGGDAAVIDELYGRVRARLLAEPERYLFRYTMTAVLLTRC